jgi:chemotaxis protein CheY-P-specific phosphatase CheC
VEVSLPLARPIEGEIVVVFSAGAAERLLREMDGPGERDLTRLNVPETSCLCEAANMLGCAYLTGLGDLTELFFEPLPPAIRLGGRASGPSEQIWVASTLRGEDGFELVLVLTMEGEGSTHLLEALGL